MFTGKHVLLVEDDPVSQYMATALLKQLGSSVTLARQGREAIHILCNCRDIGIDLILMDCLMPEMNGFEATAAIRALQKSGVVPAIPIVGLTALNTKQDHARCFEVGMDDCVVKPLRKEEIQRLTRPWFKRKDDINMAARNGTDDTADLSLAEMDCLDAAALEGVRALLGQKFVTVLRLYLQDMQDRLESIDRAITDGPNSDRIILAAHSMRSSSAHMGALRLAYMAEIMETTAKKAVKGKNIESFAALADQMKRVLLMTQQELQPFCGQENVA
jgi:CheY-like chemotaxis protein